MTLTNIYVIPFKQISAQTDHAVILLKKNLRIILERIIMTSLIHMNIRSMDLHFNELISMLNFMEFDFDIIGLTEIGKNNLANRAELLRDNYNFKYEPPVNNTFGSVGLFVSRKYEKLERKYLKIISANDMEVKSIVNLSFANGH